MNTSLKSGVAAHASVLLQVSRVVEIGSPRSDSWNPPLHLQGLAVGGCQFSIPKAALASATVTINVIGATREAVKPHFS